jgi:gamma-glutamyltranspeptidase/glutathione hydrolase
MVVADDPIAAQWGVEILRRGGNAIDAAVATGFMLSVTRPHFGSLGGGGFLVYCPRGKKCTTIDYREKAPKAATRDMYVRDGKAVPELSQSGALASGVPGVPAGLLLALEKWGKKSRGELLRDPIRLAERGIRRTGYTESGAVEHWATMNPAARKILGCAPSQEEREWAPCPAGTILKQEDLAHVLIEIANRGTRGFYRGWVANKIVDGIRAGGGIFTIEDMYDYKPVVADALVGHFGDFEIATMPLPSSGGVLLLQMLGYVERAKKQGSFEEGFGSVKALHAMTHAMALSFADRAKLLGDPDFVKVPVQEMLAPQYLDSRWKTFDPAHAQIPESAGNPLGEGTNTTHFSVIDSQGNSVAVTTTINDVYGSGFVPPGTGIFMNDEMDDFSAQPGAPNLFGLVGSEANAIAPGKRPLSSMTPTIVRDSSGNARIVIGGAGGPRILTAVFNVLVDRLVFGISLPDSIAAPRIHEQWKLQSLLMERYGFSPETREKLRALGYEVKDITASAKLHALEHFSNGRVWGSADPRGEGAAEAE